RRPQPHTAGAPPRERRQHASSEQLEVARLPEESTRRHALMLGPPALGCTGSGQASRRSLASSRSAIYDCARSVRLTIRSMNAKVAKCLLVSKVLVADGMMT